MAIPFSFLHDASGDISLVKGLALTPDLSTYVAQRLGEKLGFFLGEWFLDQRLGIPYFQRIIGERPDLPLLNSLYRRTIEGTAGVGSITTLLLEFDQSARTLSVSFDCVLTDGATITQADLAKLFIINY